MYPLDETEHADPDTPPPAKRTCTLADKLASIEDSSGTNFLPVENMGVCDGPLLSGDNINTDYCLGNSAYFSENNNFGTDFQDRTYHQLTVRSADNALTDSFGMPYVFPAQPSMDHVGGMFSCSESIGTGADFEKKEDCPSSAAAKRDHETNAATIRQGNEESKAPSASSEFCKVPSRTSLQKPKLLTVSVGEIFRRVFGPELMNVSLLGSYLRRAKEKDGGKTLREELLKLGMNIPLGRRKNGNTTTWTCFVEEETAQMAVDLDIAARKFFPVQSFAQTMKERIGCKNVDEVCSEMTSAMDVLDVVRQIFSDDCSPTCNRETTDYMLNTELQNGLYKYSCATHGFGCLALVSAIDLFQALIKASIEELGPNSEDGSSSSSIDSV